MIPFIHATVNGRRHEIPSIWFVGAMRGGMSVLDAARRWHDQTLLVELARRTRKRRTSRRLLAATVQRHPDAPWTTETRALVSGGAR
jgi:hypothetical protein